MRIMILAICFCMFLFSCKKTNVITLSSHSFVSSISQYKSNIRRVDSIMYDTSNNIAQLVHYDYDSSGSSPILDTIYTVFSYLTDSTPPNAYTSGGIAHQLMYDSLKRVVKDSSKDGSGNTVSFTYSTNTIVYVKELFVPSHSITVDSLFLTNGNISKVLSYNSSSGGIGTLGETYQYSAYSYSNPLYDSVMTKSIGPLLHFMTYDYYYQSSLADALSQKMATRLHATGSALSIDPADLTSVIKTDAYGRVTESQPYYYGFAYNGRIVYTYY